MIGRLARPEQPKGTGLATAARARHGTPRRELSGSTLAVSNCRRRAASGMVTGTSGNLSAGVDGHIVITPTGARIEELAGEDLAVAHDQSDSRG
jgi:hypothetical protein